MLTFHPHQVQDLQKMLRAMTFEPDCVKGTFHDASLGVGVGWALHKGSHADCLPVWNETREICLLLTGETYPDAGEIAKLAHRGHQFGTRDASYIVHFYEEYGDAFVEHLNGWFSGLLVDTRRSRCVLFNDRYGMGRLYLRESEDGVSFASHVGSILAVHAESRQFDPVALSEVYAMGCTLQNRSLFRGVRLLPPASAWVFGPGGRLESRRRYFDFDEWEAQEPLSDDRFYEELRSVFPGVLSEYLAEPERLGMSLTGGLDGRMIMAWSRAPAGTLPTYSFSSQYRDPQDVQLAARIAQACGQSHQVIPVGDEMLSQFHDLAARCVAYSGGAMDVTGAVELYANRLARQIRPIRLTGNYGSEVIRSAVAFKPRSIPGGLLAPELHAGVAAASQTYRAERQGLSDLRFIVGKQVPWHHHARWSVEASQLTVRSPYLDNRLVKLMFRASASAASSRVPSMRLIRDGNADLTQIPTDRGLRYPEHTLLDRARHAWLQFTFKAEYAYDYGMPPSVCRIDGALSALKLERLFLGRHKFYHFRIWYRRQLADYLRDTLIRPGAAVHDHYAPGAVRRMVEDHIAGRANHTLDLHRALTVELTHRQLLSASEVDSSAGAVAEQSAASEPIAAAAA